MHVSLCVVYVRTYVHTYVCCVYVCTSVLVMKDCKWYHGMKSTMDKTLPSMVRRPAEMV